MKLEVGQKLWWVPSLRHAPREQEVTVSKVGRKWFELDEMRYRVSVETLIADGAGYNSPGRCYLDRVAFEKERAVDKAWSRLQEKMRYRQRPKDITLETITEAMQLLGIPAKEAQ